MDPPYASLLGIPAELRFIIYKYLFHTKEYERCRTNVDMFDPDGYRRVCFKLDQNSDLHPPTSRYEKHTGIGRTCRQLLKESNEVLYSPIEVFVAIAGPDKDYFRDTKLICKAEEVYFWPFIKDLTIGIRLKLEESPQDVLDRIKDFIALVADRCEKLEKLHVRFWRAAGCSRYVPMWYRDAVQSLKVLRLKGGDVSVFFEGRRRPDYLCSELEDVIKGAKDELNA